MPRHSRALARELGAGKASALLPFTWPPITEQPSPEISRGHHRFARAGVGLFSRWDWPDPEDQALQPVCQQARLFVRAGLVEPVDDGLNRTAVTPGGFQQLLRRVGVLLVM